MTNQSPEPDAAAEPATDAAQEDAAPLSQAEEAKRRMREALARKQGVQHPDDAARSGGRAQGRSAGTTRREFRRKSG